MSTSENETTPAPSLLQGHLKTAQGVVYETIGSVSSDPSWKTQGETLKQEGQAELTAVKGEAGADRLWGKAQSAYGMLVGDQEKQTEGNLNAEKGEWKSSLADGTLPSVSLERAKAKVESGVGMVTGDAQKQSEGNVKAEKAEWLQG